MLFCCLWVWKETTDTWQCVYTDLQLVQATVNLLDLGPARPPPDCSNLSSKSGCNEVSWGGGRSSGCCFTAYGYVKRL